MEEEVQEGDLGRKLCSWSALDPKSDPQHMPKKFNMVTHTGEAEADKSLDWLASQPAWWVQASETAYLKMKHSAQGAASEDVLWPPQASVCMCVCVYGCVCVYIWREYMYVV